MAFAIQLPLGWKLLQCWSKMLQEAVRNEVLLFSGLHSFCEQPSMVLGLLAERIWHS